MPSPLQVQTAEEGVVPQARDRTVMGESVPTTHNNTIHPNQCIHNTDPKPHDNPTTLVTMVHPPIRVAMAVEGVVSPVSIHPVPTAIMEHGRERSRDATILSDQMSFQLSPLSTKDPAS